MNGAVLGHVNRQAVNSELHLAEVDLARTLRADIRAVADAMKEPWSNARAEGQINRLKNLKRQMCGRAKLDLLKARMIAA